MEAPRIRAESGEGTPRIDWEAFYANYRKPGYVRGFEIVNRLGGGMFGIVFKARKESIGKDYAIKFLKVDDEAVRDAVVRELDSVRYFAQIDHPNLVSIEDKGEVDGIPYLIMSYAGQETLQKRIQAGRLAREEALRIFVQAARGVQSLHDHSLVHFDLKPANIFLKGDIARVGDYGLSKLVTASRNSLSFGRGTPYYMAPELLSRRGDARSDIYSLGVMLYECLCGDVPFKGDSEWEVLKKHETATPEFPDHLAAEDRRIIARCLEKDPAHRFQTVTELLHALQAPAAIGESLILRDLRPSAGSVKSPSAAPPPLPGLPRRLQLGEADPRQLRDVAQSPYGLPWREPGSRSGPIGYLVRGLFRMLEGSIFLLLLPVRLISTIAGRGAHWLLKLPFRILGLTARLLGYLLVAAVLLLLIAGIVALFAGA
jgi:serine/threonine protein kinase